MKSMITIPLMLLLHLSLYAQEMAKEPEGEDAEPFYRHSLGLTIGHEHAFSGRTESGKKQVAILPFWGIDYNFSFSEKWKIGLHTDFIIETFYVEKNLNKEEEEVQERSKPFAPALMGIYKPSKHWSFGLGMGAEFAKEENYALTRAAIEYGVEMRNGWEMFGSFQYDFRWSAYDTWTLGLGVAKGFGRK